jgi:protein gp37
MTTKAAIEAAVKKVTGDPTVGPVAAIQSGIIDAVWGVVSGEGEPGTKEKRIVKAVETPEA